MWALQNYCFYTSLVTDNCKCHISQLYFWDFFCSSLASETSISYYYSPVYYQADINRVGSSGTISQLRFKDGPFLCYAIHFVQLLVLICIKEQTDTDVLVLRIFLCWIRFLFYNCSFNADLLVLALECLNFK